MSPNMPVPLSWPQHCVLHHSGGGEGGGGGDGGIPGGNGGGDGQVENSFRRALQPAGALPAMSACKLSAGTAQSWIIKFRI